MKNAKFCNSLTQFTRRKTHLVNVGNVAIGSDSHIVVQSMCTTSTMDTKASVEQAIRIADAGGELVRYTAQGVRESENLKNIKAELVARGYNVPLVADIHFNPKAAFVAAENVEKVRINPGNFVDKRASFDTFDYTEEQWSEELQKLKIKFTELLDICEKHDTALRIGVNHGSLSDRIMSRWGDTPQGMTASALEFLEIAKERNFDRIVVSMKSSNTCVMVHAYRMLSEEMSRREMTYPFHLGVTEAGEGDDGRIRSAVGIGALLADGLGDTLRVSLTEEPECEIPVARLLAEYYSNRTSHKPIKPFDESLYKPFEFHKFETYSVGGFGGELSPRTVLDLSKSTDIDREIESLSDSKLKPDFIFVGGNDIVDTRFNIIRDSDIGSRADMSKMFIECEYSDFDDSFLDQLKNIDNKVVLLHSSSSHLLGEIRAAVITLRSHGIKLPVVVRKRYETCGITRFQIESASDFGVLFIDSLLDGIWVGGEISACDVVSTLFSILQSARVRITKTEYISCPGCGRTLYALQDTLRKIKSATEGFNGIKIAVMGCIVNGPGEMADADYGYVGSGVGVVTLYKGKNVIKRNIKEQIAVSELVNFIKNDRQW